MEGCKATAQRGFRQGGRWWFDQFIAATSRRLEAILSVKAGRIEVVVVSVYVVGIEGVLRAGART